eukprot:3278920-Pleurochrysis_carterae.AAC.1
MAVARIYWGIALFGSLRNAYHAIRALKLVHTHVGWDIFMERVNRVLRLACAHHVSRERAAETLEHYAFTDSVDRSLDALLFKVDGDDHHQLKNTDRSVAIIKDFLNANIGSTFSDATCASDANLLGIW